MFDLVRVNTNRNEDAMFGLLFQVKDAFDQRADTAIAALAGVLEGVGIPFIEAEQGLLVDVAGAKPDSADITLCVCVEDTWAAYLASVLLFAGQALMGLSNQFTGTYHLMLTRREANVPKDAVQIQFSSEDDLGRAVFFGVHDALPVWESYYGAGTASFMDSPRKRMLLGIRRNVLSEELELGAEFHASPDGAMAFALGYLIAYALYREEA